MPKHELLFYRSRIYEQIPLNKTLSNFFGLPKEVIESVFGEPEDIMSLQSLQDLINYRGEIDKDFLCIISTD